MRNSVAIFNRTREIGLPAYKLENTSWPQIFFNAVAPAFFLGAVAAFVSLMTSRLAAVSERISSAGRLALVTPFCAGRLFLMLWTSSTGIEADFVLRVRSEATKTDMGA